MIKNNMSIKKCLTATLMAGTMVLTAVPVVGFNSDAAVVFADKNDEIVYNKSTDTIQTGSYLFYYIAKGAKSIKKIPAADKWTYIEPNEDDKRIVDISGVKTACKVYLSDTPSPSNLNEIVELSFDAKAKSSTINLKADPASDPEIAGKDEFKFLGLSDTDKSKYTWSLVKNVAGRVISDSEGEFERNVNTLLQTGGTIYFSSVASGDAKYTVNKKTTATELSTATASGVTRPSQQKAVKIAKRPNAPAVKVDYAKHTFTIKKGAQYQKVNGFGEIMPASWNAKVNEKTPVTATAGEIYAVRVAADKKVASKVTYVSINASADASFDDNKTYAYIIGESGMDATLYLEGADKNAAFQYVFTNTVPVMKDDPTKFNYSEAATSTYKWKTVKTGKSSKVKTIKLAKNSISDAKYVMVRRAANGANYSSAVRVFEKPGTDSNVAHGWRYVEFADWNKGVPAAENWKEIPALTFVQKDASGEAVNISASGNAGKVPSVTKLANNSSKTFKAKGSKSSKAVAVSASASGTTVTVSKASKEVGTITEITIPAGGLVLTVDGKDIPYQAITCSSIGKYSSN